MAWRVAKSLEMLRSQVDKQWPKRSKSSDGTIGDTSHQATRSDHNPNARGVVTAMDITHDPAHGLDARKLAETLIVSRDSRIKYIISNAQIVSKTVSPWQWRPYSGGNEHRHHVHISVDGNPLLYDNAKPWKLDRLEAPTLPDPNILFRAEGKMSTFGGPKDTGVRPQEGLALFVNEEQMKDVGLGEYLLPGPLGLARRLDPDKYYVAARWPKELYSMLRSVPVVVQAGDEKVEARAVDWGPAEWTKRAIDLSPGLAKRLGLNTNDRCTVTLRKP